jgi:hypothetical protein
MQFDRLLWIIMSNDLEQYWAGDLDTEFLAYFPTETFYQGLAPFPLAPRKLPEPF